MKKQVLLFIGVFIICIAKSQTDTIIEPISENTLINKDTTLEITSKNKIDTVVDNLHDEIIENLSAEEEIIYKRMKLLDESSPIDFSYNKSTLYYINRYLEKDVKLISRMLGISPYYFPMMEQQLDRFQIPLELKYLSIVESSLNPKARSRSGATGLWQFMYPTGKEYGLKVTSYIDERQDPLKSTIAACTYFEKLYNMFGDWDLVLAAYNGGPGTLKRAIAKTEFASYWDLRPYLPKETQEYVPKFIAISYAMTFYKEHEIEIIHSEMDITESDTISFKKQVPYNLISDMFCVTKATLNYLNPAYKKDIIPLGDNICLPKDVIMDVVRNEDFFYEYLEKVENKEILVNESRLIYIVEKGDYLGKIAKQYNLSILDIKQWNNLHSDNLSIGDKLILFIPDES
ncbi:MAG TPA: transglycosylase SLT domain-containing protein [Flavobacteriales bacterium]|nr:transglycosylase SLT domain-containing protein [Flavobacteriales bacterium]